MYKILRCLKSSFVTQGEIMLNAAADQGYRTVYFLDSGAEIVIVMKKIETPRGPGRPRKDEDTAELGG